MISMRLISNFVCESHPLACKCAIGVLALMRMETLYSVSYGHTRRQAGDAVSMLGQAFDLELLVPLGFASKLTGRTFPFSDSGHS